MKPDADVRILPATEDDIAAIGKFFYRFFYPEEPLNSSLNRLPSTEEMPFLNMVKDGLSLKAVNVLDESEESLAGVVINKVVSLSTKKTPTECPKQQKIHKILGELEERSKVWEVVNYEDHFNIVAVSVNSRYRGLKIGQKLVEESLRLAKSKNFKFASIECSSFYSARFAAEMGFELLAQIPYEEYLDENKIPVFKVNKPHVAIQKLIKRL